MQRLITVTRQNESKLFLGLSVIALSIITLATFSHMVFLGLGGKETFTSKTPATEVAQVTEYRVSAGVTTITNDLVTDALNTPVKINPVKEEPIVELNTAYISAAERYIAGLSGAEAKLNRLIFDTRQSDLDNATKISIIGQAIAEEGNITYELGTNFFNWDNSVCDKDFLTPGCYYKNNMVMDCSTFMQYLIWISTGSSEKDGILIGRCTYLSSIEGVGLDAPTPGCLLFKYNGGLGVERASEELLVAETPTEKGTNHVAFLIDETHVLDCSSSANGVRVVDLSERPEFLKLFTWYRNVLTDENYVTTLEQSLHS